MLLGTASTIIYPYIIPMLIGRTFDIFKAQVGVDIFSREDTKTPIQIHRSYVTSDFRLIRNDSEARSFLGITEDVSLRVKAGVLQIGASGDYLRDVQKREQYVEILVKSMYETFTETLHGSKKPIKDWDLLSPDYLGTHFVRSVTYGGMMLASLRLYVKDTAEKTHLEEYLASHFSFNEVKVNVKESQDEVHVVREMNSFEEKFKKMMFDTKSKVGSDLSLRIKYYSTVTAPRVPQDIPSFLSVLEEFPYQAKRTNGGAGVPVTVELIPLRELSTRMVALKPRALLGGFLGNLENKLDDLLYTHNSLRSLSERPISDYDKKCKVRDFGTEVHDKLDVFHKVIQDLDTSSPEALQGVGERAIQAYEQKRDGSSYFNRFQRLEDEMKEPEYGPREASVVGRQKYSPLDPATTLQQFGYLAELAMANGVCSSVNKFRGSFTTMRRNCSVTDPVPSTCADSCSQLRVGSGYGDRAECIGVVAAQIHTPYTLGAASEAGGEAVGAQTATLGRKACGRTTCYREYCCCRLQRFAKGIF